MQSHFATLWSSWLRSRCLTNPCQSDIWWLTIARRNSYQPVLVSIYRNCAILEAWLPSEALPFLMTYPQNITVRLSLAGQTLTRKERVWSNSHQAFVLHTQQQVPNEVGVNINWTRSAKAGLCLSKQHAKKGNHAPPFVTNPINTPRNSWRVRNEIMMGI